MSSAYLDLPCRSLTEVIRTRKALRQHYTGLIASSIKRLINGWQHPAHEEFAGAIADQRQMNGAYGAHQMRVRLPDDPTVYRVIIAPADAPITIGGVPADQHFAEPLHASAPSAG